MTCNPKVLEKDLSRSKDMGLRMEWKAARASMVNSRTFRENRGHGGQNGLGRP